MDRRTFIGGVVGSFLVAPIAARGQRERKDYRVGLLTVGEITATSRSDALRRRAWSSASRSSSPDSCGTVST